MTDEEADRLLARLSNLNSLRTVYDLIRDLAHYETAERDALPFQVARLVLQDFAWRFEGLGTDVEQPLGAWAAVLQQLAPPVRDVIEASRLSDETRLFTGLKSLTQSWATLRNSLR